MTIGKFLKIFIKAFLEHGIFILSPILSLLCLFLACGRTPGQEVLIIINQPNFFVQNEALNPIAVNVSIRLQAFGNVFLKKNLNPGENRILLPKGQIEVLTGFLASTPDPTQVEPFLYSKVQQEVMITKNTNSLEVYYPPFKPTQYKKFGFIFKEGKPSELKPVSGLNVIVQDSTSETDIRNPLTGEYLGFTTDASGRASVDLPIFGQTQNIRLLIHRENQNDQIFTIPAAVAADNFEFYEVILDKKLILEPIPLSGYYMDETKTIQEIINADKNPRFVDLMSVNDFQSALEQEFKNSSQNIDILAPLMKFSAEIKTDNPYVRSGREIHVQCKPNKGTVYKICSREISKTKLKDEFGADLKDGDKIDFLLTDQDDYSIFNDKNSTREHPAIVTVTIP